MVEEPAADWHRRVVNRSLRAATQRSIDRGTGLVRAAATLLERTPDGGFTVQDVADEAGQSLRTLYQYFESKDDLLLAVFEEAMRAYATLIRDAVAALDDPLDRLAGALLTALHLPDLRQTGLTGGLVRLRLKLAEVEPRLIGRAQAPLTSLLRYLVEAAAAADRVAPGDPEAATFLLLSLNNASITSRTLGNDQGGRQPAPAAIVAFALQGLGAEVPPGWLDDVAARIGLPLSPRPAHRPEAAASPASR
jgi:AcrR family transcriptional regulator